MRIVIDTAALVSAIRSNTGAAAEIVRLAVMKRFELLMDYKLACEYREVALRPDHIAASRRKAEDVESFILTLESIAIPVFVATKHRPLSRDVNDDMVLDVAINGRAEVVITNNVKDFAAAADEFGIKLLTPGQFLMRIRKEGLNHANKSEKESTE